MELFFTIEGYEVSTACDGVEGVAAVSDFKPAVVFMDITMPRLNGYQAAEQIRALPDIELPALVAITGWSSDEDTRRMKEAGFDRILCKPVSPVDLRAALAEFLPATDDT